MHPRRSKRNARDGPRARENRGRVPLRIYDIVKRQARRDSTEAEVGQLLPWEPELCALAESIERFRLEEETDGDARADNEGATKP
jgi:hypothetical protein